MYSLLLVLHSLIRWVVLIAGLLAIVRAFAGWAGRKPWKATDDKIGFWTVTGLDVQTLIGLVLYLFLSPFTATALSDFGAAMRTPQLRFWAVEHVTLMLVGLALVHVGRARAKRAPESAAKHRTVAIFFLLGMIAVLVAVPWPGTPNGRPLFRGFGL